MFPEFNISKEALQSINDKVNKNINENSKCIEDLSNANEYIENHARIKFKEIEIDDFIKKHPSSESKVKEISSIDFNES